MIMSYFGIKFEQTKLLLSIHSSFNTNKVSKTFVIFLWLGKKNNYDLMIPHLIIALNWELSIFSDIDQHPQSVKNNIRKEIIDRISYFFLIRNNTIIIFSKNNFSWGTSLIEQNILNSLAKGLVICYIHFIEWWMVLLPQQLYKIIFFISKYISAIALSNF